VEDLGANSHDLIELIRSRRSIRWFKQENIPEEDLTRILEAGIRAPTASGGEQWMFAVIKDESKRKVFHDFIRRGQIIYLSRMLKNPLKEEELRKWETMFDKGIYFSPIYVIGLLNFNRRTLTDEYLLYEYLWGVESVSLALENMMLSAWSLGYGTVWLAVPKLLEEELKSALNLPPNTSYVGALALGRPNEQPQLRPRQPLESSVIFF
jgi:nitroreductase